MIIVEQGKIVEVCTEPGEFIFDSSTEPSIFEGRLCKSIENTFKTIDKRFAYGGDTGKDQRIFSTPKNFENTKEIRSSKFGRPNPIILEVVNKHPQHNSQLRLPRCRKLFHSVLHEKARVHRRTGETLSCSRNPHQEKGGGDETDSKRILDCAACADGSGRDRS